MVWYLRGFFFPLSKWENFHFGKKNWTCYALSLFLKQMTMKDSKCLHSAVVALVGSNACDKQDSGNQEYIKWRSLEEIISYLL